MKNCLITASLCALLTITGCETNSPSQTTEDSQGPKKYVVYDFGAPWCGPCRAFAPTFEEWKTKYTRENVVFKKVNIDEDQQMAAQYRIKAIPTVIVTSNGKEIGRFVGECDEGQLAKLLQSVKSD